MPEFIIEFGKGGAPPDDGRLDAAAFHRNHEAIAPVLEAFLRGPHRRRSGDRRRHRAARGGIRRQAAGDHLVADRLNDNHLRSIAAWRAHAKLDNVKAPSASTPARGLAAARTRPARRVRRDILRQRHPHLAVDGGARPVRRRRPPPRGGRTVVPLWPVQTRRPHNAPSNAAFDDSLRRQNPDWGVRDIADLRALARSQWPAPRRRPRRCRRTTQSSCSSDPDETVV